MVRIALLRGINVGGHRRVPMAELRSALLDVGFETVETYIQSGNAIVSGGPEDSAEAADTIGDLLLDRFGIDDVGVIVMSRARLERARAVSAQAFPVGNGDPVEHAERVHIVVLAAPPSPTRRASLHPDEFAPDRFILDIHEGTAEFHVAYAVGAGSSQLTLDRIERGFGVRATGRNLNTVDRLIDLAASTS